MAYLTYSGANTGSPNSVDAEAAVGLTAAEQADVQGGRARWSAQSGCLACHVIGDNGNNGPGPSLTHIGPILRPGAIASTLRNPTAPMPSFKSLAQQSPAEVHEPRQLPRRASVGSRHSRGERPPPLRQFAATPARAAGTLRGAQVRAMFDRIAGVYDLLNTVMTAGLHHQWRRRAADLAALSVPAIGCSTSRPAPATWRSSSPGASGRAARWSVRTSRSGCWRSRARRRRAADRASASAVGSSRPTRSRCRTPTTQFDAATVGFGARNFSDLRQGLREMARVVQTGWTRRDPRDHDAAPAAAIDLLQSSGSTASCRRLGRARRRRRRLQLPTELGAAVPGPGGAGGDDVGLRAALEIQLHPDRRRDHRDARREVRR